jgi:hypothetical protein
MLLQRMKALYNKSLEPTPGQIYWRCAVTPVAGAAQLQR